MNAHTATAQNQKKVILYPSVVAECVGGYLEGLPNDYASTTQQYPLLIFIHGIGEVGAGDDASLNKMYRNGPPNLMNNNQWPSSFTVNGKTFKFIVLSPQFNHSWPSATVIQKFIDYAKSKYRVDASRIYLTGLSMGGATVWSYPSASVANSSTLAAIAPVCGASGGTQTSAGIMASQNLPIWAFHNDEDPTVDVRNTIGWVNYYNAYTPKANPQAKMTIFDAASHNAWSKAYDPAYKENNMNVYEWMLQYTNNRASGAAPTNNSPTANAGSNVTITLPTSSVTLDGSGSKDSDGTIAQHYWSQTSGPATAKFSNQWIAKPTVSGMTTAGTYVFSLKVTDNLSATATASVQVTVNAAAAAANKSPTVTASVNTSVITLPTSFVNFVSVGTDSDGSIASYQWSQVSGPTGGVINNPTSANMTVYGIKTAGTYVYKVEVTDNAGAKGSATVSFVVNAAPTANQAPVASAGGNKTITLPTSSLALVSSSTDADGTISSTNWTQVSGPATAVFSNQWLPNITVSKLTVAGVYTFKIKVTDNQGATGETTFTVTVEPDASALVADAGDDFTVQVLPAASSNSRVATSNSFAASARTTTVTADSIYTYLDGSRSTGGIQTFYWYQLSGPNSATFGNAWYNKPKLLYLTYGTYKFVLRISDLDGAKSYDTVAVTVKAVDADNATLFANAGTDQKVSLSPGTVTLDGSASYTTKWQIIGYNWSLLSGPAKVTITDMWRNKALATGFTAAGTYRFVLRVTDIQQTQVYDTVDVVVGNSIRMAATPAGSNDTVAARSSPAENAAGLQNKVYPNPVVSTTTLLLNNNNTGKTTLTVYNASGVAVYLESFAKNNTYFTKQLNLAHLVAGTYFIKVQTGSSIPVTLKIQKL
ncbi:MAG: T9SS type A sorting domain-containing protein [Flavihumibacter sp.]